MTNNPRVVGLNELPIDLFPVFESLGFDTANPHYQRSILNQHGHVNVPDNRIFSHRIDGYPKIYLGCVVIEDKFWWHLRIGSNAMKFHRQVFSAETFSSIFEKERMNKEYVSHLWLGRTRWHFFLQTDEHESLYIANLITYVADVFYSFCFLPHTDALYWARHPQGALMVDILERIAQQLKDTDGVA